MKRVRFEEDTLTRCVKQRVLELPLPKSSLLTPEEKQCYWMQWSDHRATLQDVMTLVQNYRSTTTASSSSSSSSSSSDPSASAMGEAQEAQEEEDDEINDPNKVPFAQYAEALAITFTLCGNSPPLPPAATSSSTTCGEPDDDKDDTTEESPTWNIRASQSVAQLALWASHHTPSRGVESKILPGLYQERQAQRARAIHGVLLAQKQYKAIQQQQQQQRLLLQQSSSSSPVVTTVVVGDPAQHLCAVSERLTHSAKEFASAMAVVDGTQALMEYSSLPQQEPQQQQQPRDHDRRDKATVEQGKQPLLFVQPQQPETQGSIPSSSRTASSIGGGMLPSAAVSSLPATSVVV